MADTGWLDAATFSSEDFGDSGEGPWSNPSNAGSSDDSDASIGLSSFGFSDWLQAVDFSAGVPSGAAIDGIEVQIEAAGSITATLDINGVTLVDSGKLGSTKSPAQTLTASDAYYAFGGASDVWSATLTSSIVNSSTFGFAFRGLNGDFSSARTIFCDHMQLKVYYTLRRVIIC